MRYVPQQPQPGDAQRLEVLPNLISRTQSLIESREWLEQELKFHYRAAANYEEPLESPPDENGSDENGEEIDILAWMLEHFRQNSQ